MSSMGNYLESGQILSDENKLEVEKNHINKVKMASRENKKRSMKSAVYNISTASQGAAPS